MASTWSAAGSAMTALTTSFTIDILGAGGRGERQLRCVRSAVHVGMAVAMTGVVLAFRALAHTSVIDAVYVLASYSYGPVLGMFVFGMTTRRAVHDRWVPLVALLAPALCLVLDLNSAAWFGGYRFGYELLILNALFTIAGLTILIKGVDPSAPLRGRFRTTITD
jgi:hypothetical protein